MDGHAAITELDLEPLPRCRLRLPPGQAYHCIAHHGEAALQNRIVRERLEKLGGGAVALAAEFLAALDCAAGAGGEGRDVGSRCASC